MLNMIGRGLARARHNQTAPIDPPAEPPPPAFDPEAGLTLTRTIGAGVAPSLNSYIGRDVVFATTVTFPATISDGVLFEYGGAGTGHIVVLRASDNVLRLRAGDGASSPGETKTVILDVPFASLPTDGSEHRLVWDIRVNPGRLRFWVDGVFMGEGFSDAGGVLEGSKWSGTGSGGFATGANANVGGEPRGAWPGSVTSDLLLYNQQQVSV